METVTGWDRAAADFQRLFKNGQNEYNESLFAYLAAKCGLREGISVIDVGCGVGKYGVMLSNMGCSVTLTDISPKMLDFAAGNMAGSPAPWRTVAGEFSEIYRELGNGYDLAISTMSPAIHDLDTVKKMSRLSDGFCFVSRFAQWSQPNRDKVFSLLGLEAQAHADSPRQCRELIAAVKDAGYEPQICYVDYNWRDRRSAEEEAEYLRQRCGLEQLSYAQVLAAVERVADKDGFFDDAVFTKVMWLYWKSR